jgi:hypothetical protein
MLKLNQYLSDSNPKPLTTRRAIFVRDDFGKGHTPNHRRKHRRRYQVWTWAVISMAIGLL